MQTFSVKVNIHICTQTLEKEPQMKLKHKASSKFYQEYIYTEQSPNNGKVNENIALHRSRARILVNFLST